MHAAATRLIVLTVAVLMLAQAGSAYVANENTDELPAGCNEITGWENSSVTAGRGAANPFPDKIYAFSKQKVTPDPCTRMTVTFINTDSVRHQWMVHHLPEETYPGGYFLIANTGPDRTTGTFITPNATETYLVNCDIPQHGPKGMRAMLQVNGGDGTLPAIPGLTEAVRPEGETNPQSPDPTDTSGGMTGQLTRGQSNTGILLGVIGILLGLIIYQVASSREQEVEAWN